MTVVVCAELRELVYCVDCREFVEGSRDRALVQVAKDHALEYPHHWVIVGKGFVAVEKEEG